MIKHLKYIFLIILLIPLGFIQAQNLTEAEYFFDADPGIGNGTSLSFSADDSMNMVFDIPTTGLYEGFHTLFIRFKDDNNEWGLYEGRTFYVQPTQSYDLAQELSHSEYFFDTDPGIGNGTAIAFTPEDTLNTEFDIPTTGLGEGFHTLFIRFKDDNNKWGLYEGRTFYVQPTKSYDLAQELANAEYFFDTDPGIGNGTAFDLTADDSLNTVFDISPVGLTEGFHTLFFRFRDDNGIWSLYEGRTFYVQPPASPATAIVAAEYYLNSDPGFGSGTNFAVTESDSIDQVFDLDLTGVVEGDYLFSARMMDNNGVWSFTSSDSIKVSDIAATASFTYVRDGFSFDFTDNSTNAETWTWNFGDETTDETNSTAVSHTYSEKGNYEVCLTVSNEFFDDTYCETITIPNEAPTALTLSNASLEENNETASLIGEFTTTDTDDDIHTYTLISGEGDTDNASFYIENDSLMANISFDFETKNAYSVRVKTDDGYDLGTFEEMFMITVEDGNDDPHAIALSNSSLDENLPSGTFVGELSSSDQDLADTHSYTLVNGEGDADNSLFTITEDSLKTSASLDFETQEVYNIRIQSEDNNGGGYSMAFTVSLNDINDVPLGFNLLTPANEGLATSLLPVMDWENAIDPEGETVSYTFYLGHDNAGVPDDIYMVENLTESVYEINVALEENNLYYWKVVAFDNMGLFVENNGGWHTFLVNTENQDPNSFSLITPTDSSVEIDLTPIFYWENAGDPDPGDLLTYALYVGNDESFSEVSPMETNENFYVPEEALTDNSQYFWKVIASDPHGTKASIESETLMFWTNTALEPPMPFELKTPLNASTVNPVDLEFVWNMALDNDPNDYAKYALVIASDMDFANELYAFNSLSDTTYLLSDTLTGGDYFWKVIAMDTDMLETESGIFTFSVAGVSAPMAENISVCFGEEVPDLEALGENIKWYNDASLSSLLHSGNTFATGLSEAGVYTYYVTQTIEGTESDATEVTLSILELPAAPVAESVGICFGEDVPALNATGEEIQWYSDIDLTALLGSGSSYAPGETETGEYIYYVTQTAGVCESEATEAVLTIIELPAAPTTEGVEVCFGEDVPALTASGDNIQWYADEALTNLVQTGSEYNTGLTSAGNYSFYVTSLSESCESEASMVSLIINSLPDAPIITQQENSLISSLAFAYQWLDVEMNEIESATAQTYIPTANGTYYVRAGNEAGCNSVSEAFVFEMIGLADFMLSNEVSLYPNPTNGIFTVSVSIENPLDYIYLDIYNSNGVKIKREKITEVSSDINYEIDLSDVAGGLYLVKIITNEGFKSMFVQRK